MATVTVLLALVGGPGMPQGSPGHGYEIELALDASGRPDSQAWAADPQPWRARRLMPGAAPAEGDVQFDPDNGWSIRFYGAAADSPDVPEARFHSGAEPIRPGEYAAVQEPDGSVFSYRVVGIG